MTPFLEEALFEGLWVPIVIVMTRSLRALSSKGSLACLFIFFPIVLFGQKIRIAEISMVGIGDSRSSYPAVASAVAPYDVVATDNVRDPGDMEKVLAGMDDKWEAMLSKNGGFYGFFYNDRLRLARELGAYPAVGQFARPPYGVLFQVASSGLAFNLVVCRLALDNAPRAAEIGHLAEVYRYFEKLTGNRGITILTGRFGDEHQQQFQWLATLGGEKVVLEKGKGRLTEGSRSTDGHILVGGALRPRIEDAGIRSSALHPVYLILRVGT